MLKHIEIKGYRSLKDVSLDMEPLNVLIGPNASVKPNFMDVFALLNETRQALHRPIVLQEYRRRQMTQQEI